MGGFPCSLCPSVDGKRKNGRGKRSFIHENVWKKSVVIKCSEKECFYRGRRQLREFEKGKSEVEKKSKRGYSAMGKEKRLLLALTVKCAGRTVLKGGVVNGSGETLEKPTEMGMFERGGRRTVCGGFVPPER